MIAAFKKAYDTFRGVAPPERTVPVMDGPLRPNTLLDQAPAVLELAGVDNLLDTPNGLLCSVGADLMSLDGPGGGLSARPVQSFANPITCLASDGADGLAIGLDGSGLVLRGGPHDGRAIERAGGTRLLSPTSALFLDPDTLIVSNGSSEGPVSDWKRDLMAQRHKGSVWRLDLRQPDAAVKLADGLAFPNGLAGGGGTILVSEAWRNRIVRLAATQASVPVEVLGDLPAYPSRIIPSVEGGFWLALFAPRNQLIEFVITERRYCGRMMERVHPDYWIAPALSSGASFLEPIQGGARKKLNTLKPWSPSWSYGLVVRCDARFKPVGSFHSRADGHVHGITALCERQGRLLVAARGSGRIVSIDPLADPDLGDLA
ncbi:MAG: hypothetical protein ACREFM_24870 [Hypericibacter sp.]